jgi:ribonuclease HII
MSSRIVTRHLVCGVDEAGRGPLAGAVYAAAVVLDPAASIDGLRDSKQLSERKREQLAVLIRQHALAWHVATASVEEIDRLNIHHATLLAMARAVRGLSLMPNEMLVDGLYCPDIDIPARAIVKGDATIAEISAASILAKTARDEEMRVLDSRFPEYGFARHKGYPTKQHIEALQLHGVSELHRRSYAPVAKLLGVR